MKFGCLYYSDSENVGDDIQTYAQWRFLPRVDYWIDRESLHIFCPDEEYKVALIMNAWFMYTPQNWPPSPYIYPLFISTHFSKYHVQWLRLKEDRYSLAQKYLKKNEPIGCRDGSTLQTLQELGIKAYFSGCLTLTLRPFADVRKQDYVCLVDVPPEIVDYVKKKGYNVRVMSHNNYALKEMSPEERLKQAEGYLRVYQGARCILTSRLHCALPCTGIGTPVLVLYSSEYDERFRNLKKFLHTTNEKNFLDGSWDSFLENPFCCSTAYMAYADCLSRTCDKFVNDVSEKKEKVSVNYKNYYEIAMFQNIIRKDTYIAENHRLSKGIEEAKGIIDDLHHSVKAMQEYNANQEKAINELRNYSQKQEKMLNELRNYSQEQEKAINELRTMNDELRSYSQEQEKANVELNAQASELKKQLDNMQNLSEKERKLIRFLRRRHR